MAITERVVSCALQALEASSLGQSQLSSRTVIDNLNLNMTLNVGYIQSIMPEFGTEMRPETEIVIYFNVSNLKA